MSASVTDVTAVDLPVYVDILVEGRDRILTITLNRPAQLNAISPRMLSEVRSALQYGENDPGVAVIVIRGAGRAFSVGGDYAEVAARDPATGLPEGMDVGTYMQQAVGVLRAWYADYLFIADMRTPVISQVHGWCLGGASWLAVATDLTVAADDAVFGQPEVREGRVAGLIWALVVGWKNAMRYALTGDHLDASEALRIGLVNEVVPREQLDERGRELARRITCVPQPAVEMNKRMIRRGMDVMGFREALLLAAELSAWQSGSSPIGTEPSFDELVRKLGPSGAARARDRPFWPEPFGPHAERGPTWKPRRVSKDATSPR